MPKLFTIRRSVASPWSEPIEEFLNFSGQWTEGWAGGWKTLEETREFWKKFELTNSPEFHIYIIGPRNGFHSVRGRNES